MVSLNIYKNSANKFGRKTNLKIENEFEDFKVKFDFEGQGQSTPKTIGISTKRLCMSGLNLVILAGTSYKLSRGQARDWRPHKQTQATTIPEG